MAGDDDLDRRHPDADLGAALAYPRYHRQAHRPGRRRSGAHPAHHRLFAHRRRHGRCDRPPPHDAGITQSAMALTAVALALLTINGDIDLWHIYLLTAIQAIAVAFDSPSRQALVPNLVPARDLPNAFSMTSIALQTGAIIGPALSGLVIAYWSQSTVYIINALSYLAVIIALILMGPGGATRSIRSGAPASAWHPFARASSSSSASPSSWAPCSWTFFATFFAVGQHAHAHHRPRCAQCGRDAVRLALGGAVHRRGCWRRWWSRRSSASAARALSSSSSVVVFGLATIVFGSGAQLPAQPCSP